MLRPNGNCGEIRESYCVSLPHRSEYAASPRGSQRDVSQVFARSARPILSGRQKHSGKQDLCCGCGTGATAVLDAISGFSQVHDSAPTSNCASIGRRGWRNVRRMGETEKAGAVWVKTLASLAATGTTGRTPVLVARTGTTLHRTRTTTSGRASSVSAQVYRSVNATAWQVGLLKCGQPDLSSFGEHKHGFGITPSRKSKGAADISMPKRHRHLIEKITTIENLRDAYRKTANNKRMTWGYLEFKEYAESNLLLIQEELRDGAYKIGPYRNFIIYEPKARLISALDFKDRLVQHALCNVITPIFEKSLMPYTFACRVGLGTHAGVRHIQALMRSKGPTHFLKTDFSKFFPSVDHVVLHNMIDRKIGCELTLKILREIIPTFGKGLPIGSLTSQLFANVYANPLDHFIHHDLKHRYWARYMDDIVILDYDPARLRDSFQRIVEFSNNELRLSISKWSIGSVTKGVNFLGYRIWHDYKLLRKDSVVKAKRKVAKFIRHNDQESLRKFIASWRGHAQWANTHNLFNWMEQKHGICFEKNH